MDIMVPSILDTCHIWMTDGSNGIHKESLSRSPMASIAYKLEELDTKSTNNRHIISEMSSILPR